MPGSAHWPPPLAALIRHCCAALPLQVDRSSAVPLADPCRARPGTYRRTARVPSGWTVQFCAACPPHAEVTTGFPAAVLATLVRSGRCPGPRDTTGPAGSVHFWLAWPLHAEIQA